MAIEVLDPAGGSFLLDTAAGPATSATYVPNTQADYVGDGNTDDYALYQDFTGTFGFLDSNAVTLQVVQFDLLFQAMDPNGNARVYIGSWVDAMVHGAKNAGAGCYVEVRGPNAGNGDVGYRFGTLSTGAKNNATNDLILGTQYHCTLTFDPAAVTVTLDFYTDVARTVLYESSGAVDCSGGDAVAGGQGIFQPIDAIPRNKGAAPYQVVVANVDLGLGPPTFLMATLQNSNGNPLADGTVVREYNSANGALIQSGTIDSVATGVAGGISFQHANGDPNSYYLVADPQNPNIGLETLCTKPIGPV